MFKRTDLIGFAGLVMLVAGAILFLTGMEEELSWLTGTIFWFAGFGLFLGWIFWRAGTFSERPPVKSAAAHKH